MKPKISYPAGLEFLLAFMIGLASTTFINAQTVDVRIFGYIRGDGPEGNAVATNCNVKLLLGGVECPGSAIIPSNSLGYEYFFTRTTTVRLPVESTNVCRIIMEEGGLGP